MPCHDASRPVIVRGTEIVSSDSRQRYREKIARITLDSMVEFVGLPDAEGTVLEINKVALDAVGLKHARARALSARAVPRICHGAFRNSTSGMRLPRT